jgi:uncharacterized phage protein (TIGR01671 family)
MREIKFRTYVKSFGKIMNVSEIDFQNESVIANDGFLGGLFEFKDVELMQYTGLKDKNGKEIYEGDIVSAFYGSQVTTVILNEKFGLYEVVLQVSGLTEPMEELLGNHLDVVEVIGNIYENSELMEGRS